MYRLSRNHQIFCFLTLSAHSHRIYVNLGSLLQISITTMSEQMPKPAAGVAQSMHEFWSTQPVPQDTNVVTEGPLEKKDVADVPQTPYPIASVLEWWVPDVLGCEDDLRQIYELLRDNYVEDDDSMFRFNYSHDFLKWALTPPGYIKEWHVAVRKKADKSVVAFISGIPIDIGVKPSAGGEAEVRKMCEINFLCIHKRLREKKLAPILIKEVTRRVNCLDIWQAVYTAGIVLPTPFTSAQYFHRSLNPEKLVAIRFSRISPQYQKFQNPMQMMKRNYAVADAPATRGFRQMQPSDVPAVHKMLNLSLSKYHVAPTLTEEDVVHWMLPREGVVFSFVVEDPKTGEATDFVSFYSLPSTVIGNSKYNELNAAYTFYYSANTLPLKVLMADVLCAAKKIGFDVVNTLDILDNKEFINELKFGAGDGKLHYYFYNWGYPTMAPKSVGLVML